MTRNAGKLAVGGVMVLLFGVAQAVLVARSLGPRDFGLAALVLSFPPLVFTFFDAQAAEAVVKYLGRFTTTGERRKALAVPKLAYAVDVGLALVGFALVAASSVWVAGWLLHSSSYAGLLVVVAATQVVAAPADTSRAILTSFDRFSGVAWVQAGAAAARFALVVVLLQNGGGIGAFVIATCVGTAVESVLLGWLANRALRTALGGNWWAGRVADVRDSVREMGRFLLYTDQTSLVAVFVKQADIVILGMVAGPVQAGYYRLARSLAAPATSVITSLQAVLYPQVARVVAGADSAALMRRARRWFLLAGLPLAALSLVVFPFVPEVIRVLSGPEFVGATASSRWLLAGSAFVLASFWLRPVQLATGQVRFMFLNGVALGVVCVVAFFILGGFFGAAGVAAARTVVAGFAGTTAGLWRLRTLSRSGRLIPPVPAGPARVSVAA
ncbi:MAG TPA: lipopolysaccharide biosynthesis protein [Actinomycetes bacterium]|nr:lipopolysaccharide biosynthesis protein [Actinomycetes bacterium]